MLFVKSVNSHELQISKCFNFIVHITGRLIFTPIPQWGDKGALKILID